MRTLNKQPKKPFFIISAEIKGATYEENKSYTDKLGKELKDLNLKYMQTNGSYKGRPEVCYLVTTDTLEKAHSYGSALCEAYDQESFIVADSNRNAECIYFDGNKEKFKFLLVNVTTKEAYPGWFHNKLTDKYYTLVRR
tara:strand:- start:79 stop:495 length:417 start_codon:yes stop_codon:yes gene_type:complete